MSLPGAGDKSRTSSVSSGAKLPPPRVPRSRVESRSSLATRPRPGKADAVDAARGRLHHLLEQIEKEFDVVLAENLARKWRLWAQLCCAR